jgi:hypothetical protein
MPRDFGRAHDALIDDDDDALVEEGFHALVEDDDDVAFVEDDGNALVEAHDALAEECFHAAAASEGLVHWGGAAAALRQEEVHERPVPEDGAPD